ncbi:MAG: hypothetical protein ACRD2W_06980 [Acidimicrobiales bacterium]
MSSPVHNRRAGFWVSAALGWAVIAVGVRGIFEKTIDTRPGQLARFVIGGALLHDLVVAPLAILAGVGLARVVRGKARPVVQAALVVTAVVVLFAYPLVRAYGLAANNPTSLPHNYTANLAVVLALVWAVAGVAIALRYRRAGNASAEKVTTTSS